MLHIGFPEALWHELHDAGRIDYHPVFPGRPGYASRALATDADVEDAIALLRLNYDRAVERHGVPCKQRRSTNRPPRRPPRPAPGAPGG